TPVTRDSAAPTSGSEPIIVRETILVIEDEEPLRLAVAKMLRKGGYSVVEAGDGNSGVELFRGRAPEIDLVLLDMTLPGRSGEEVLQGLRRIRADVSVIITTAYNEDSVVVAAGGQQPWLYLRKPYQFSELLGLLRTARQHG